MKGLKQLVCVREAIFIMGASFNLIRLLLKALVVSSAAAALLLGKPGFVRSACPDLLAKYEDKRG